MAMILRLDVVRDSIHGKKRQAKLKNNYCKECNKLTREGKPYCTDHVLQHPYIKQMLEKYEQMDQELFLAYRRRGVKGQITATSNNIKDLVMHLSLYGPRTIERICRELNWPPKVANYFVGWLRARGAVTLSRTKRGSRLVTLVGYDPKKVLFKEGDE